MDPYQPTFDQLNPSKPAIETIATFDWNTLVAQPLLNLINECIHFIPNLVAAIYILVFAWIIGKVLEFVIGQFLKSIRFDAVANKIGLGEFISGEKDAMRTPSKWAGIMAFWLTICIALVMALDRLRLNLASKWLDDMINLLISIFAAVTILTLGIFLSEIVARIVHTSAQKLGIKQNGLYSAFIRFAVLFFTLMLTLMQFHVPGQFVLVVVGAIFLTLCVTFTIAFGVGGSGWAARMLDKISK